MFLFIMGYRHTYDRTTFEIALEEKNKDKKEKKKRKKKKKNKKKKKKKTKNPFQKPGVRKSPVTASQRESDGHSAQPLPGCARIRLDGRAVHICFSARESRQPRTLSRSRPCNRPS